MTKQEALVKIAELIKEAKSLGKEHGIIIEMVDFEDEWESSYDWNSSGCTY